MAASPAMLPSLAHASEVPYVGFAMVIELDCGYSGITRKIYDVRVYTNQVPRITFNHQVHTDGTALGLLVDPRGANHIHDEFYKWAENNNVSTAIIPLDVHFQSWIELIEAQFSRPLPPPSLHRADRHPTSKLWLLECYCRHVVDPILTNDLWLQL